MKVVGIYGN